MNSGRDTSADAPQSVAAGTIDTFVAIVSELGLLSPEAATRVSSAALQEQMPPCRYALLHGALQPADADIVETLLHPTEAVPGYDILGLIGKGGMGVVYRARQRSLNRPVALKTILLSQVSNPTAARRFEQEAQALARLTHPHIVSAYDFGRHGERLYFAMELIEGEDVEAVIRRRGALPESLVWPLIRQAAAGLAHAAHAGIVHRDVKPANLLLVPPPEGFPLPPGVPLVKVADFGLALLAVDASDEASQRLTSASVHVGSPVYMAPEQLESGAIDQRADIFSLGATAWHMLAGYPPLHGKSLREVITLRLSTPTEPIEKHNPRVSEASSQLLAAMLQPNPAHRLANYDQLLNAIDHNLVRGDTSHDIAATMLLKQTPAQAAFAGPTDVTTELPSTAVPPTPKTARRVFIASCLAGALLLLAGIVRKLQPTTPRGPELIGDGRSVALFDGRTLTGWKTLGGAWQPGLDEEGGAVLQGTNGIISRSLSTHYDHFLFELHVAYDEAQAVEIQFDFAPSDLNRLVLRIEQDTVTIGRRSSDQGAFNKSYPLLTPVQPSAGSLTVRIERQREDWRIMLDGEDVAIVPLCHPTTLPEIRLRVDKGTAQFADLFFEALVATE